MESESHFDMWDYVPVVIKSTKIGKGKVYNEYLTQKRLILIGFMFVTSLLMMQ